MPASSRARRSLTAVRPGEYAEIRAILFHEVRVACERAGVREGDVVLCSESGPSEIVLRTGTGTVSLSMQAARFVAVGPARAPTERGEDDARPTAAPPAGNGPGEGSAA